MRREVIDRQARGRGRRMSPPSIAEIFLFPLIGALACDLLVTRRNELYFFCLPFIFVFIRMYLSQLKSPVAKLESGLLLFAYAKASYLGFEYAATLVLLFLEWVSVFASGHESSGALWALVAVMYAGYVMLRLVARSYWRLADGQS